MYNKHFGFNLHQIKGPSKITNKILNSYNNTYYPYNLFEFDDFIPYDDHFVHSGTRKIAKYTFRNVNF